ncbi:hypothetical protein CN1A_62 [Clavibacter phage CN1A]|uniref:Uncharacterized protein n=1 Tax=Clavibacter phage CN1A TaxID=1406793 RepID=U5PTT9_9CAUD|nr:hypothetical protein CN1A_62 [Clavibacter phage CN1A]AGY47171.1 hypothetical protein CN1A_62 [Clavibacter phage CN1A]
MTKANYDVKYTALFKDFSDAMNTVRTSLYLADINANDVHVDLSAEEKRARKQRLDTVYTEVSDDA